MLQKTLSGNTAPTFQGLLLYSPTSVHRSSSMTIWPVRWTNRYGVLPIPLSAISSVSSHNERWQTPSNWCVTCIRAISNKRAPTALWTCSTAGGSCFCPTSTTLTRIWPMPTRFSPTYATYMNLTTLVILRKSKNRSYDNSSAISLRSTTAC